MDSKDRKRHEVLGDAKAFLDPFSGNGSAASVVRAAVSFLSCHRCPQCRCHPLPPATHYSKPCAYTFRFCGIIPVTVQSGIFGSISPAQPSKENRTCALIPPFSPCPVSFCLFPRLHGGDTTLGVSPGWRRTGLECTGGFGNSPGWGREGAGDRGRTFPYFPNRPIDAGDT